MSRSSNYTTVALVRALHSKLVVAIMSDADLQTHIDSADNYIDTKMHGLYQVPFTTTPLVIGDISKQLALYYALRVVYSGASPEQSAWLESYKKMADEQLEGICNGTYSLIDSTGTKVSGRLGAGIQSTNIDFKPVFNDGDATDWEISEDKVNTERDKYK